MKPIIKIALVLAVFAGSAPMQAAYGQAPSGVPKAKITKKSQLLAIPAAIRLVRPD
jgi:hypothetical protein